MAWPYANGPLHLGHVAGNCLPADIQYRYERSRGRSVIMCSGSDEHGTPITVTADEENVSPQIIVDRFHQINTQALIDLGCSWGQNIDSRGVDFGGTLYNRTTDLRHKELVQEHFSLLLKSGFLKQETMQQYCSINSDGDVKFLPDRYVEGECPICGFDGARGDQCDECGATYESSDLVNPRSKMDSEAKIEIRDAPNPKTEGNPDNSFKNTRVASSLGGSCIASPPPHVLYASFRIRAFKTGEIFGAEILASSKKIER